MATIMSAFAKIILERVNAVLEDETVKKLANQNKLKWISEVRKLAFTLSEVVEHISDLEGRENKDARVKVWISKLRETMYAAEDHIDICYQEAHEAAQQRSNKLRIPPFLNMFQQVVDTNQDSQSSLKSLNSKMDEIKNAISELKENTISELGRSPVTQQCTNKHFDNHIHSLLDVLGREVELDSANLVEKLTENSNVLDFCLAVVGPAGIGKTALAWKIYDDQTVKSAFSTRLWVRVMKDFNNKRLLEEILTVAGGKPKEADNISQLIDSLSRQLRGRRFLLVLDDVWGGQINESLLKALLREGADGKRLLLTTRDAAVATAVNASHTHFIRKLTIDDGWLVLQRHAFLKMEDATQDLRNVGASIIKKCDYLPVAVRIIGGLLSTKDRTSDEWEKICNSPGWSFKELPEGNTPLIGAIYVGYNDMSPYLKQCLLYCSLFPPLYVISQDMITRFWISEGLVEPMQGWNQEQKAEDYYKELLCRGLLQLVPGYRDTTRCIMHRSVWSFVQFLTREEIWSSGSGSVTDPSVRIRRLFLAKKGLMFVPEAYGRLLSLRTLNIFGNPIGSYGMDGILKKFKHLRVLDLGATQLEGVPAWLDSLVHLRHLNLSRTRITELPESIAKLENLQYLGLQHCKWLHTLPKGITKLANLTCLDLYYTLLDAVPPSVLSELTKLTELHGYVIGDDKRTSSKSWNGWPLDDLKNMNNLRSLQILNVERASTLCLDRGLFLQEHLKELELVGSPGALFGSRGNRTAEPTSSEIFKRVDPPKNLTSLKIVNFSSLYECPWISESESRLTRLEKLHLIDCTSLPEFGMLRQLRYLEIAGNLADQIKQRSLQTVSEQIELPPLELHIKKMKNLVSWSSMFDRLKEVHIEDCPKLASLPEGLHRATVLTKMKIHRADSLEAVGSLPMLKELEAECCGSLTRIEKLPLLEVLVLCQCPRVETVEEVDSLCHLRIRDADMGELPGWLERHALRLCTLSITGKKELLDKCLQEDQGWPVIGGLVPPADRDVAPAIREVARVYADLIVDEASESYFTYNRGNGNGKARMVTRSCSTVDCDEMTGTVSWAVLTTKLLNWIGMAVVFITEAFHCFRPPVRVVRD